MTILITGANRGVGRALLDHYRAAGADAMGTARGTPPPAGAWLTLDVTVPEAQRAAAAELAGRSVSILVCNAGVYLDKGQPLANGYPAAMWAETFAANVTGVFLTVQAFLPNLRSAENPRIAIVSSRMGSSELAPGGSYIYRASKAAAVNLGRNLAADLRGDGIAVGIYHPGWVRTDMGGGRASVSPADSAAGLAARIESLTLATSGRFETYDGTPLPL